MPIEREVIQQVKPFSHQFINKSANLLTSAFLHDPLFIHALPNEQQRGRCLPSFFTHCIHYGELFGESYSDISQNGLAIWLPPGNCMVSTWQELKAGMWLILHKMGVRAVLRLWSENTFAEGIHKRFAPDPHWYLFLLGVDPASQGCGLGSLLLQPILARADMEHIPCYLETNNPDAVRFYQKHDFNVVLEHQRNPSDPCLWAMRRERK